MNNPRQHDAESAKRGRRYHQPILRKYGNVRDITLAPTPVPEIESGRGAGFRAE